MKKFNELGISKQTGQFVGDKIKIERILNCEITVYGYKIEDSKIEDEKRKKGASDKCLYLQIIYKGEKRVVFTGSKVLMGVIVQVDQKDFPFKTTIIKEEGGSYQFT